MTHTPGPWSLHNSGGECNVGHFDGYLKSEIKAGSDIIYIRQSVAGNSFPQLVANLGLMIAAPDMKLALEHVRDGHTDMDEIMAAIAKAEGRETQT